MAFEGVSVEREAPFCRADVDEQRPGSTFESDLDGVIAVRTGDDQRFPLLTKSHRLNGLSRRQPPARVQLQPDRVP